MVVGFCSCSPRDMAGIFIGKPPARPTPRFPPSTRCFEWGGPGVAARLPYAALHLLDALLEMGVAGVRIRPGVDDADHRLAGVVAAVVAHLRGARAMAERAQVVHPEPAVAAQLFGFLALTQTFLPI